MDSKHHPPMEPQTARSGNPATNSRDSRPSPHPLNGLDWSLWLSKASELAHTESAKMFMLQLLSTSHWAQSKAEAEILQLETWEILPLTAESSGKTFLWTCLGGLQNPDPFMDRLAHGGTLWLEELAALKRWLEACELWSSIPRDEIKAERFRRAIQELSPVHQALNKVRRVLADDGTLLENASPKLYEISQEIKRLKRDIGITLDTLVKDYHQQGVLQENYSDYRDGRYVLPVRVSSQSQVPGQIYGSSVSHQTVFVEPVQIAPLNLRLQAKEGEKLQEVFRILEALSTDLRPECEPFKNNFNTLIYWDVVQAKAKLGQMMGGKPIRFTMASKTLSHRTESTPFIFQLYSTANPLLWFTLPKENIVRNDIHFESPYQTLLISGPNTGGKTVFLKTIGLAAVFARTGFLFPASETPVVPYFDSIFCDLGDDQSLENHTSSFSGHLLKFKRMLDSVASTTLLASNENLDHAVNNTEQGGLSALVLLDELNTATDPEEGAALGRALLEWLMEKGVMVVTTTHDPRLKLLAAENTKVLNASMAFDDRTRKPTFQIQMGLPGRSRALDTAERFGLPAELIKKARGYLSSEHNRIEETLKKIEDQSSTLEELRREASQARLEAVSLREEWKKRTETGFGELLTKTRQKLRGLLEQAQDEVRRSVRKLDEAKSRKDVDQARQEIGRDFQTLLHRTDTLLEEEAPEVAALLKDKEKVNSPELPKTDWKQTGTWVRIPKWKNIGQILENHDGKIKVVMGALQVQLSESDIFPLSETEIRTLQSQRRIPTNGGQPGGLTAKFGSLATVNTYSETSLEPEIDLRGMRFEEAMTALGLYLDRTFRSGNYVEVTIIHGLGTGALREGTRKLLKKLPYVQSVRDGGAGHGGAGATIVEFGTAGRTS